MSIDLTNQRFGKLTALYYSHTVTGEGHFWHCRCDCGNEVAFSARRLKKRKSCGCSKHVMHGMSKSREYSSWEAMVARCHRTTDWAYAGWGGKGVTVCDRWRFSFSNFFSDMGLRPPGKTLDRIDNTGNYEPNNCRWATPKEQCRNRSSNVLLEHEGETKTVAEWAELTGIKYITLDRRLAHGWAIQDALTLPVRPKNTLIEHDGATRTLAEWAKLTGLNWDILDYRLKNGWTVADAFTRASRRSNESTK